MSLYLFRNCSLAGFDCRWALEDIPQLFVSLKNYLPRIDLLIGGILFNNTKAILQYLGQLKSEPYLP